MSKGELKLQAAEYFAKSELQSVKQHCDLQKQIFDCCCDLKELVREENHNTRSLLKQQESDRLREELAAAKQEALALRLKPFQDVNCVSLKPCCGNSNGNGPGNS